MLSAVRLPTPPPPDAYPTHSSLPRKRSPPSRSPSPRRTAPYKLTLRDEKAHLDYQPDHSFEHARPFPNAVRPKEVTKPPTEAEKQSAAQKEYNSLLDARSGGTYIPPAKLRALQAQLTDKSSKEYQRMAWEALKKAIKGLVNKVNTSNIKFLVREVFSENLLRGKGIFARATMQASSSSIPFIPIYACLVAIVNSKLPQVGELLLKRLIVQFKKAYKRNDKAVCLSSTTFIAHLVNFQVAHELIAAEALLLLLNKPTDDGVEIAVALTREVGQHLSEMNPPVFQAVMEQFRNILHENDISTRVAYMIEVLFQTVKDKFKGNPAIPEGLDVLEEEDMITHRIGLDDEIDTQATLDIFKYDPEWEENELKYQKIRAEILGEDGSDDDEGYESEESSEEGGEAQEERALEIKDETNAQLVNLRRTIYLTLMSSVDFEEACHKLSKLTLPAGLESELPSMIIECCSQEKTFTKYHALVAERFCKLNRLWRELFEEAFAETYNSIHRRETAQLRNVAKFWGHQLSSDAIGWHTLSVIHLNEEDTTSSSRIFIKIMFQDLSEALGMKNLQARLKDDIMRSNYEGIFPMDNARNTRFSINYFTSIGMGGLTEEMREYLKNAAPLPVIAPPKVESDSESASSYSSYSSYSGSSRSYSRSRSPSRSRAARPRYESPRSKRRPSTLSRSRTPPRREPGRGRERRTPPRDTYRRARSYTPSDASRTPSPRRVRKRRSPSYSSRSRTPPPKPERRRRSDN